MIIWKSETEKIGSNLKTAFSGLGMRGLAEILKQGNVLAPIKNEEGRVLHNDRIAMIVAMVGPKNMATLIDRLCDVIMEMNNDA